ncbi:uncharacterized protein A4U43_C05F27200 [Asparagus officinalis]|uniref:RNA-dependent RNA polymerase n=1 Tax=Asparagus officinalis TaxID=4686 RepID=A0A5P1EV94_ASPOF|nr:probable RNA-dependent RNA polymerase SHL2 [Asparagus officinalis]ONK69832.1 uncharacterized protein A4U43_C05F27200 [Asparagus officinalis]
MGSLDSSSKTQVQAHHKDKVITQVSIAGFDAQTTAESLHLSLEKSLNCVIWRSRLKSSSTPPDSYPDFEFPNPKPTSKKPTKSSRAPVVPHAFLQFGTPAGAQRAIDAAGRCELLVGQKPVVVQSSADSLHRINRRRQISPFVFKDVCFEIGSLVGPSEFAVAWRLDPKPDNAVEFLVDPFDSSCKLMFSREVAFTVKGTKDVDFIRCNLKLEFLLRDVMEVKVTTDAMPFVFLIQMGLGAAPLIYYRTADDDIHDTSTGHLLDDEDPWIRSTDFTPNGAIGRCNCYRISMSPRFRGKLEKALAYMRERRIEGLRPERPILVKDEGNPGFVSSDPFFCFHNKEGVSFVNMFMVNALVHKGIFNQHRLTEEFFGLLRKKSEVLNDVALRHIYGYKKPIFDAYGRLKMVQDWLLKFPRLIKAPIPSDDNMEVRRLVITPTKAYCLPPEIELANRVLRKYRDISDRFLRVTFMDEGMQSLNIHVLSFYPAPIVKEVTISSSSQKTTMFRRVRDIMYKGFHLCGRKYSFLAFSSNQLRDKSAWFFAEDKGTSVQDITSWMGKFQNKNVAKYAARMGQCFSSTYATVQLHPGEVNQKLPDIENEKYCFSDGIGKITPALATEVAEKLRLTETPPSAYQIRFAGCKGVVAVWPGNNDGIRLSLRPSMNKFQSSHSVLEVVSWTRFQPGFLNRQIVTLLSALGVDDDVFSRMQDSMVSKLDKMLIDPDVAFDVLTSSCAEQGNIAAMMLSAGFTPQTEPHLKAMLLCIRLSQLKDLSSKARIFVPKGRWLMGCLDELGVLEEGQCFIQVSSPSLENCFLKHGSKFSGSKVNKQVIVGTIALAKNPCLHPGDIRILEAVDVPGLHHLVDCLVFPQKGERPHSNEASGSDLDGDLYFVTWDENLIPPSKKSWPPLDYEPAEAKEEPRKIVHQLIVDFFVRNMSSENLGVICNAHVVHADLSDYGAMDDKCLKLAKLAAIAVDFPKTGVFVNLPASYKPKLYPDFMNKDEHITYKSEKILGRLYRKIKSASDEDNSSELISAYEDLPYDQAFDISEAFDYLTEAWETKCSYDRQLNALLGQFRVDKEGEVVTGHISSLGSYNSRKQGEVKERLKNAYYALNKKYRRSFEEIGGHLSQLSLSDDERNQIYESKAAAWYQVTYHPKWVKKSVEMKEADGERLGVRN